MNQKPFDTSKNGVPPQVDRPLDGPNVPHASKSAAASGTQPSDLSGMTHAPNAVSAAAHAPTVSAVLGEIVWLMSQSQHHKHLFIADIEWMVMTPLLLGQFRLFHGADPQVPGQQRPIGCIFWALATPEVAAHLQAGITRMRPIDWRPQTNDSKKPLSLDNGEIWIVDCLAPFGGATEMIADLKEKVFARRDVRWRAVGGASGREL